MAEPSPDTTAGGPALTHGRPPRWGGAGGQPGSPTALLSLVLVVATAGLVYELVMAAVASYVLGDSVRQFSLVIGLYLSALGLGAYLSRWCRERLAVTFVDVELAAALVGGLSAPLLFVAFGFTASFELVLYAIVTLTGVLVGVELPLLIRILERQVELRELIARALTFDYAGALVGSLAFSLVLVPYVGLAHTSVVCGLLNAGAALTSTWLLPATDEAEHRALRAARLRAIAVTVSLIVALTQAGRAVELSEAATYPGRVVVATQSAYQRIVLVDAGGAFELYLSGNLQFSSSDEHRYHEALVHPAMAAADKRRHVFIGGGGDGLAAREVLKWRDVETITLVDLDPAMTDLARTHPRMVAQNRGSLDDSRVKVINADAMRWLGENREKVDVMIFDFPDPSNYSLGKLYSTAFYRLAKDRLATGGALSVQASSPFFARRSFWCIVGTIESAGLSAHPYRAFVPSFGDWGFVVARSLPFPKPVEVSVGPLRFLSPGVLPTLFDFPADSARVPVDVNRLNNQALVNYYLDEMRL